MLHPFSFLIGYARFSVSEAQAARFIEICAALGLSCKSEGFRPTADGAQRAFFICSASALGRVIRASEQHSISLYDLQKRGIPYLFISHFLSAKRLGLTLGLICACVMIFFSGRVLWDVRIEGNDRLQSSDVLELLEKNGVCIGTAKKNISTSEVENRILIESDDIAWISINIRGTVATVEIKEALPSKKDENIIASNMVSAANGTVERIEDVKGNLSVSLGDAISRGQLLIGGIYDANAFNGMRYTRARGKIFARCEKDFHIEIPLVYDKKVYTGNKKTQKSLIFFNFLKKEVNFFGNSRNSYASCDKIITEDYFDPFGIGKLPFGIRTVTYLEYEIKQSDRDIEMAMEQALHELSVQLIESSPEYELLRKQISTEITDTALILDCHIVCVQNVAVEKEIEISIFK